MQDQEPLTESYFYILLCLYQSASHGYGIMQETARMSNDRVKIGSGTMYGAISNMIKKRWIVERPSTNPEDYRKKMYEITLTGRDIFESEYQRLKELVSNADTVVGGGINL